MTLSSKGLIDKVKNVIIENNLIEPKDKILVAVSGGPDSLTLLYILDYLKQELKFTLEVAHVNHKIRKESDEEKIYVEEICEKLDIPFHYLEVNVISEAKKHKMGLEEYARKVRYDFFDKVKSENSCDKVAVAHNLNDKAETILLNIIRGCALKGIIGMEYETNGIIRPMLDIPKKDIMDFCRQNKINPCIDKTNFEEICTRNKIRLKLIPMIEDINPNFLESINRMSGIMAEDEKFINRYVDNITKNCIVTKENDNIIFNYEMLNKEDLAVKTRVIRNIINMLMNNLQGIEKKHILDIIKLIDKNITGKKYIIGNKFKITVLRKNIASISFNK